MGCDVFEGSGINDVWKKRNDGDLEILQKVISLDGMLFTIEMMAQATLWATNIFYAYTNISNNDYSAIATKRIKYINAMKYDHYQERSNACDHLSPSRFILILSNSPTLTQYVKTQSVPSRFFSFP